MGTKNKVYRIGTRGSLLAVTQATITKNYLEEKTGEKFELVKIKTQGDKITNVPLWQLDGKDFFTKELDEKLLSGEIDLVIHSYKDLGSDRPDKINLACITERKYPHDILLIRKDFLNNIESKNKVIVGTSSPRRITNLTNFLGEYLPSKTPLEVETKILRGNVNTRIEKLKNNEYDAICLALAGLERLAHKEDSKQILEGLIEGLQFMLLPLSVFPTAASQGALGIECCKDKNPELFDKLNSLQDEKTTSEVKRERKAFASYGGGCHLSVGISVIKTKGFFVHYHHGEYKDKPVKLSKLEIEREVAPSGKCFLGMPLDKVKEVSEDFIYDELVEKIELPIEQKVNETNQFVTSNYCFHALNKEKFIWSSGTFTMKKLARAGVWCSGSADGIGTYQLKKLLESKVVQMFNQSDSSKFITLSHDKAKAETGQTVACYTHKFKKTSPEYETKLKEAKIFYWSSYTQYQQFIAKWPWISQKIHACGLGKTYDLFKANNININPFLGPTEFKQWLSET